MPMRKEIDRMGPLNFKGINIDCPEYFHKNRLNNKNLNGADDDNKKVSEK